jgi:hypothetical protein
MLFRETIAVYCENHTEHTNTLKISIFWDVTPCSPLKVNRHFGGTCRLHLQQTSCYLLSRWFLARLILRPWRWRRHIPPKCRLTFNGLYGIISQKLELFITTAVRTSNPRQIHYLWLECSFSTLKKVVLREMGWGGMDWINLAQDRDRWGALVNTVMNFHVS